MHPTRIYHFLSFSLGFGMFLSATTYVPFLLGLGLSLSDVALLNAGFFSIIVLAEIPTGMLADGKSRAWSIRMGIATYAVAMFCYAFAAGFWTALSSEVLAGVASAFLSGAQQAWLADALAHRQESERLSHAFGTAAFVRMVGAVTGGLLGSIIGLAGLQWPYVVAGFVLLVALVFAHRRLGNLGEPRERVSESEAFRRSLSALRRSRSLMWVVVAAMAFGLVLPFNHYWAPYFRTRIGEAGTGILWVPMFCALALAGLTIRRRGVHPGGEAGWLLASLLLSGLGLAGIGAFTPVAASIGFVFLHELGRGLFDPIVDLYTQRRVESEYRATYGSLQSFLGRFGYAAVLLVIWWSARNLPATNASIVSIWTVTGLLLVGAAAVLWLLRPHENQNAPM